MIIYTDGGCRGNPGPAGIGVVIKNDKGETTIEIAEFIGTATNNVAEYKALIRALEWCHNTENLGNIQVYSDSRLLVDQVCGRWKIKDSRMKDLHGRVHALLEGFMAWGITQIPREQNKEADALANLAMDRELAMLLEK